METSNEWRDYQKLVLSELQRLDTNIEKFADRMDQAMRHERVTRTQTEKSVAVELNRLAIEVNLLKLKAGICGLLGGLLPVLTAILVRQL